MKEMGTQKRKKVTVEGIGGVVELFHFGKEKARLMKRLAKGEKGEPLLIAGAEWHEYQHLPWWKEAIDAEGKPVEFLDVPVALAARDAKIADWQKYFRPSVTIEQYHLTHEASEEARFEAEEWVRSCIQHVLQPKLKPHFSLEYSDFLLRLIPVSEEALKSRFTDQSTYKWALEQIIASVQELEQAYLQKQSSDIMRLRM